MSIFSISDIIISITLILNAIAIISSRVNISNKSKSSNSLHGLLDPRATPNYVAEDIANDDNDAHSHLTFSMKFAKLVSQVRNYSCILALWNIIFIILMAATFD